MCNVDLDKRYPVKGEVWFRHSTKEWILEITYGINDTGGSARHTCPEQTRPEDVPGLDSTYEKIENLEAKVEKLERKLKSKKKESNYLRREVEDYKRKWKRDR